MMIVRLPMTLCCAAVLAIAGCDETAQTANTTATPTAATVDPDMREVTDAAQVLANVLQDDSDRNLGNGANIRSARAQGSLLIMALEFPFVVPRGASRSDYNRRYGPAIRRDVQGFLCQSSLFPGFLAIGGTVQVDLFGRGGRRFGNTTIASC